MDPVIDGAFPGGNAVLERIDGDDVYLHQDLRDTEGDWFYWYFRVQGAAARTLRFHFTRSNVIGVRGPAVSRDGGITWSWLGAASVDGASFEYCFAEHHGEVRFSFGMPYVGANLNRLRRLHLGHPHLQASTLCRSPKGRPVELLDVAGTGAARHRLLVTARHHCCEMMASYVLEGLLSVVLEHGSAGSWFREHVACRVVPFVDRDGVEDGDQGKNRRPRDHNRDYDGESVHVTTRAIRDTVPDWCGGLPTVALDLHCPWIRGPHNEVIYLVGSSTDAVWQEQCRFADILQSVNSGPLVYDPSDNLPFGQAWNTADNFGAGKSFTRWAGELPGVRLATSIEVPYANARGRQVNAQTARAFGRDVAHALCEYMQATD